MLYLASHTDATWVARVAENLDELLLDHAHCEKKAASTAINLIFRYDGRHPELARPLAALAREELEHFDRVLELLATREVEFGPITPGPYAALLMRAVHHAEPQRVVDTLLCAALIEARSCERMTLLARHLQNDRLRSFYGELLESEARHFIAYVDLARALPQAQTIAIETRLRQLAEHEAQVLAEAPADARVHGGWTARPEA